MAVLGYSAAGIAQRPGGVVLERVRAEKVVDVARAKNPLRDPAPERVPLPSAPLIRVIAQVRFQPYAAFDVPDQIASFVSAIKGRYPVEMHQVQQKFVFQGETQAQLVETSNIWRFAEQADGTGWQVSLSREFVALETTTYSSRDDFMSRLSEILALVHHMAPALMIARVGVRYIDQVKGAEYLQLAKLAYPDVAGIPVLDAGQDLVAFGSDAVFRMPDGSAQARLRTAKLPSGQTIDAAAIPAIPEPSWVLDVDTFGPGEGFADIRTQAAVVLAYSDVAYRLFRWAVTDEFLSAYGGTP